METPKTRVVIATGLAYSPELRDWVVPVRYEARSRLEAIRWINFQKDWCRDLKIEN